MTRRERGSILGDILGAIDASAAPGEQARLTTLTLRANLPHDRLTGYLRELAHAGLVTTDPQPRLTPAGHAVLREYRDWTRALARAGLDIPSHPVVEGTAPRSRPPR